MRTQNDVFTMPRRQAKSHEVRLAAMCSQCVSTYMRAQNDVFTMSRRQAKSHEVRLAIAYALAQSIKLSV